jgi:metal-responsive CopG/Arc/MetJ family transcriptional regulator
MRVTVSLPDSLARRFQAAVPSRRRSSTVARLLEVELTKRESELAKACAAANADFCLAEEIDAWQAFDDVLPPTRTAARPRKGRR